MFLTLSEFRVELGLLEGDGDDVEQALSVERQKRPLKFNRKIIKLLIGDIPHFLIKNVNGLMLINLFVETYLS